MNNLTVKKAEDFNETRESYKIRTTVFVEEQGIAQTRDEDGEDCTATHIVGYLDKTIPISCARIRFINGRAKLERIATLKEFRGEGYGSQIVNFAIEYAKKENINEVYLHAQNGTQKFYEKFGFKQRGESFEDAGILHVEMFREELE